MPRKTTLLVKAAHADRPCPKADGRNVFDRKTGRNARFIYSDAPQEVPNIRFYRRRIAAGDLVEVTTLAPKASTTKAKA